MLARERGPASGLAVQAPVPARLARLAVRGIRVSDAQERIARQATDEERAAVADILIDNSGDQLALADQVDRAWATILAIADE